MGNPPQNRFLERRDIHEHLDISIDYLDIRDDFLNLKYVIIL